MSESFEQVLSLMSELSFSDKLRLNAELATSLKKEGKTGSVTKGVKKEKTGRTAAPGTLAWVAFVKHCKDTMPERFTDTTKEPERLTICKAIRAEDPESYKTFTEDFKAEHASSKEEVSEPEPEPVPVKTKAEKMAAAKTALAAAAAKKTAAPAAPAAKKPAAPAAPKKPVKKAPAPKKVEEEVMPKLTIDGETYYHDTQTNSLWQIINGDEFGPMIGVYHPENEEGDQIEFADDV